MPIIPGIDGSILPTGELNVRSNPGDFGSQIGEGMSNIGKGFGDLADSTRQLAVTQDVTYQHNTVLAKARMDWTTKFQNDARAATPGDDSFAPRFTAEMQKWFADAAPSTATPEGKRAYEAGAAGLIQEFNARAISWQGQLASEGAKTQHETLVNFLSNSADKDSSQLPAALASAKTAIDAPNSIYSKISQADRDAMFESAKNRISLAAAQGFVRDHPGVLTSELNPELFEQFQPYKAVLDSYAAKGSTPSISPETLAKAPEMVPIAASKGLNPNILLAQADITAPEDKQAPMDQANTMSTLVSRSVGDYEKALAAYHMGTDKFDGVLSMFGNGWKDNVPPETKKYVDTVLANSGTIPPQEGVVPPPVAAQVPLAPPGPVIHNIPMLDNLTPQQQHEIITEDVQALHLKMTLDDHARREQEIQKAQASEKSLIGYSQQILNPSKYGQVDMKAVADDPTLGSSEKMWVSQQLYASQERQLHSATQDNPVNYRKLWMQIHAKDDDPSKIYNGDFVVSAVGHGSISPNDGERLLHEVETMKDPNGSSIGRRFGQMSARVSSAFRARPEFIMNAAAADQAWADWQADASAKMDDLRAQGKNPASALDPHSKDYVMDPTHLNSFLKTPGQALADGAAKKGDPLPTYKDWDTLGPGVAFTDEKGNVKRTPPNKTAVVDAPATPPPPSVPFKQKVNVAAESTGTALTNVVRGKIPGSLKTGFSSFLHAADSKLETKENK